MTPVLKLFKLCELYGLTFTAAESLTGGMIGASVTSVSGASRYFWGGFVTYTEDAKMKILGVKSETLSKYGVVSEQCAREMALGAISVSGADCSVAVTGFAGPGGSTDASLVPVGSVWIAATVRRPGDVLETKQEYIRFSGNRDEVRSQTVARALSFLAAFTEAVLTDGRAIS